MSDKKISALTDGTTADATDAIPIARSGLNYYITPGYIKTYLGILGNLSVASGKTLTSSNTLTLAGTDGSTLNVGSGGTLSALAYKSQAALTTDVSGVLPVANGGSGSAAPSLIGGTNVTISGTWPNQTIDASGATGPAGADGLPSFDTVTAWAASTIYTATNPRSTVTYLGSCYVCSTSHTSTSTFDPTKWTQIAAKGDTGPAGPTGAAGPTVYPGAGIAVSTGSAWDTSYSVSGTGAVALTNSPSFVTPDLGVPSAVTLTYGTGLPVSGISATGTASSSTFLRGDGAWAAVSSTPGGSTTQVQFNSAGAFGGSSAFTWDNTNNSLTVASGTLTTSQPGYNLTQTWSAVGTTFTAFKINVTDSNSAAGSSLVDWQVGGSSKFKVDKNGLVGVAGSTTGTFGLNAGATYQIQGAGFSIAALGGAVYWSDLSLTRAAAATLRLGAADTTGTTAPTAQTFRVQSWASSTTNNQVGADWKIQGSAGTGSGVGGKIIFEVAPAAASGNTKNAYASAWAIDGNQALYPVASQSTSMTNGFLNIPGGAGAPSGTPANTTGFPLYWDSTNLKLYVYSGGAWKSSAAFT